ncbi:MAG TPA: LuxR C-terminal-related transcriptional regulator [Solirubrobacterales bacterium]|nr:LuxR C-terminal-related transcriptional regulator [Solirubrobacterales bacterium]
MRKVATKQANKQIKKRVLTSEAYREIGTGGEPDFQNGWDNYTDQPKLMAEGRPNAAVAERLVVTERAVEQHVTSIFGKLNLTPAAEDHRRVLAVLTFLRS